MCGALKGRGSDTTDFLQTIQIQVCSEKISWRGREKLGEEHCSNVLERKGEARGGTLLKRLGEEGRSLGRNTAQTALKINSVLHCLHKGRRETDEN